MLDPASPVPLHHQLTLALLADIERGVYRQGDRMPTEAELCRRHGLSRTPVRKAMSALVERGVVVRYRKRGTFVREAVGEPPSPAVAVPSGPHELVADIAAGAAPAAAVVSAAWVPSLVSLGAIRPVEIDADPLEPLWLPDVVRATWEHGGRPYGVPVAMSVSGLWVRTDALDVTGGRMPRDWGELRTIAVAARDLMPGVSSPVVVAAARPEALLWLLLAASGADPGTVERRLLERALDRTLTFLRRLIDHGLLSADVVGHEPPDVVAALRRGDAVVGVGSSDLLGPDEGFRFGPFPGATVTGGAGVVLAEASVGVVPAPCPVEPVIRELTRRRSAGISTIAPAWHSLAHTPPVTTHPELLADVVADVIGAVLSGSITVGPAVTELASPISALVR